MRSWWLRWYYWFTTPQPDFVSDRWVREHRGN
jgi:hypothetical protein